MEQNFQDIYGQLQSRIRQAEDKRLQLKAKGTKNGLIAGGITLVAGVVVSLIIGGGWPGILIACMLGLIVLFSCIQSKSGELCAYYKENIISSIIFYISHILVGEFPSFWPSNLVFGGLHKDTKKPTNSQYFVYELVG